MNTYPDPVSFLRGPGKVAAFATLVVGLAHGAPVDSTDELQSDMNLITTAGRSAGGAELERVGDRLHDKWKARDNWRHADVMLKLCQEVGSGPYPRAMKHKLLRKYSLAGLADQAQTPIETLMGLADYVGSDLAGSRAAQTSDEWAGQRRADAILRLQVWKRLLASIDPTWNPNDKPLLNVAPPASTGLPAGIGPSEVKSPQLRAQYEATIDANNRKAARYHEQYTLRNRQKGFVRRNEEFLVEAYSKPPRRMDELEGLLKEYVPNEQTSITRILKAVDDRRDR